MEPCPWHAWRGSLLHSKGTQPWLQLGESRAGCSEPAGQHHTNHLVPQTLLLLGFRC